MKFLFAVLALTTPAFAESQFEIIMKSNCRIGANVIKEASIMVDQGIDKEIVLEMIGVYLNEAIDDEKMMEFMVDLVEANHRTGGSLEVPSQAFYEGCVEQIQ